MTAGGRTDVQVAIESHTDLSGDPRCAWAQQELITALADAGITISDGRERTPDTVSIVLTSDGAGRPESFGLRRDGASLTVDAGEPRGLMYGLLELTDVVRTAEDPLTALSRIGDVDESPATPVRGVLRTFCSDIEDRPWLIDRTFWTDYLDELATHRINRLHLALGMSYNYSHDLDVQDNYLGFAYPFLLDVPGFDVTAEKVDDHEREENLAALRYIGQECRRRGIHFQLGLWNHAYEMPSSPRMRYPIRGLTPDNHADYCAAALTELLTACPEIDGLTFRVHYEGGVPEPGHAFWQTTMAGIRRAEQSRDGRQLDIDMHSKGVDAGLIDVARSTGARAIISAKYLAEHQGLPYHQSIIRRMEEAREKPGAGLRAITQHQRRFTRYGYGDFLPVDRDYDFLFRIWPGTQRLLLWGDPVLAAGYGRQGTIGGSLGIELCEPLAFKGRKTTASPGDRDPYADPALQTGIGTWRKYRYTYRLWGRLLYNPDSDPSVWRRWLRSEYGPAADDIESALGHASRILPLVTTAHGPSASNNFYWPEMYTDMAITEQGSSGHYNFDTPEPGVLGTASPFDPGLFSTVNEYADEIVSGVRSGRYSPLQVADWLESLAAQAEKSLTGALAAVPDQDSPDVRRVAVDVAVQAKLGAFFAAKFRSAVGYALWQRTGSTAELQDAVGHLRQARQRVLDVVDLTKDVYRPNLTFGDRRAEQGHWADRIPALENDLAAMEAELAAADTGGSSEVPGESPAGPRPALDHEPVTGFTAGSPITVHVQTDTPVDGTVLLRYRHLNQGEHYQEMIMEGDGTGWSATIPGSYTDSPYHLTYYFLIRTASGDAWISPGLDETLANCPYHVVNQDH